MEANAKSRPRAGGPNLARHSHRNRQMSLRRASALVLIAAGLLLCGISALHYFQGFEAQESGRRVLETRRALETRKAFTQLLAETPEATPEPPMAGAPEEHPAGEPIAWIRIPTARIDAVVFEGSSADVLKKGPGHVAGTEPPGRRSGLNNCVITAHRDAQFRNLGWLRKGHRVDLETPESRETYYVVSREIVDPHAVRVLAPTEKPRLTLITCYPFNYIGPAPQRLVVVAEPCPSSDTD